MASSFSSSCQLDINENSKHFLLILGYIHLRCIDFDSDMFFHGVVIPSKVVDLIIHFVRHRFSVYAIGMNKYEEFGDVNMNIRKSHILHNVNIRGFQKCDEFSHLLSSPMRDSIYYGRFRFMIKNHTTNEIYVAGHNNLGQCGVNSRELEVDEFTILQLPNSNSNEADSAHDYDITCISSGICAKHSFIIIRDRKTRHYKVYAFGTNKYGQFGTDSKFVQPQIYPLELPHLAHYLFVDLRFEITQIACGEKHSILLSSTGQLLGCGLNDKGQCGIEYDEDYEFILEPELIEFHQPSSNHVQEESDAVRIAYIVSGREHNIALDVQGQAWAFGVNSNGELGLGQNKDEFEWVDQPVCINHTYATWSTEQQQPKQHAPIKQQKHSKKSKHKKRNSSKSHLAQSSSSHHRHGCHKIVHISAGERHSLFIDADGGAWLCGSNWYCQIGNDRSFTECQKEPFLIQWMTSFQHLRIVDASCGDYHTVMLDARNNVYTFGSNDTYQCHPPMFNGSDLQKISKPMRIDRGNINIGPHDIITKVLGAASATLLIVE